MDILRCALQHTCFLYYDAQTMKGPQKSLKIFLILLSAMIISTPGHAQDAAGTGLWSKIIESLASGVSSINIDNATLGVDKGLIQQMVVGIGRTVEKNPKSTSTKDRFLVKDRLKIGLELGAGFVVAGTVTYAQEWTLVYPVASEFEGLLSRKFVLDLFLPFTIKRLEESELPDEYVVIKKAMLEGKGRVRFGDLPGVVLGSEHSVSRINLYSSLAKRFKDQSYKIMLESSKYSKTAHALWFNLPLMNFPIFDLNYHKGSSKRTFYDVPYKDFSHYNKQKLFRSIFMGYINPLSSTVHTLQKEEETTTLKEFLSPYEKDEKWSSNFKESRTSFTFFYLFNKESVTRSDYVSVRSDRDNHSSDWWQWEDIRSNDWTIGIRGESFHSRVLFSGEQIGSEIHDPILSVHLLLKDSETTENEYNDEYLLLVKEILASITPDTEQLSSFSNYQEALSPITFNSISSLMEVKSFYTKEDLMILVKALPEQWNEKIEEITGKSLRYWDRAAKEKFHSKDRRRLSRSRISLEHIAKGREIVEFFRYVDKARAAYENGEELSMYRSICWAFRSSFYASSFAGTKADLLKTINKMISKGNISVNHRLYRGDKIMAHGVYNSSENLIDEMNQRHFPYILDDPSEIFYFFEGN